MPDRASRIVAKSVLPRRDIRPQRSQIPSTAVKNSRKRPADVGPWVSHNALRTGKGRGPAARRPSRRGNRDRRPGHPDSLSLAVVLARTFFGRWFFSARWFRRHFCGRANIIDKHIHGHHDWNKCYKQLKQQSPAHKQLFFGFVAVRYYDRRKQRCLDREQHLFKQRLGGCRHSR